MIIITGISNIAYKIYQYDNHSEFESNMRMESLDHEYD